MRAKYLATMMCLMGLGLVLSACQSRVPNPDVVRDVALNDHQAVARYLSEGGDPNIQSGDGKPLLFIAAGPRGGLEVTKLLVAAGADLNGVSAQGRTVLQNAASWCVADIVAVLLDAGADRNLIGAENKTALDVVCKSPQDMREAVIGLLLAP